MHTPYIFNQNIHKTKWFTTLESKTIGNMQLFRTKKSLVFQLNTMYGWYSVWWYQEWKVESMKISSDLILTDWHYIILDFVLASAIMAMTLQQLKEPLIQLIFVLQKLLLKKRRETLRVLTIAMICFTLALLWKSQYFQRPIYNHEAILHYITQSKVDDGVFIAEIASR